MEVDAEKLWSSVKLSHKTTLWVTMDDGSAHCVSLDTLLTVMTVLSALSMW